MALGVAASASVSAAFLGWGPRLPERVVESEAPRTSLRSPRAGDSGTTFGAAAATKRAQRTPQRYACAPAPVYNPLNSPSVLLSVSIACVPSATEIFLPKLHSTSDTGRPSAA